MNNSSPVVFEEHVCDVLKKLWILGAKKSTCDLIHYFFQLRDLLIVGHGIIPEKQQCNFDPLKKKKSHHIPLEFVFHPFLSISATSSTRMPKMKRFSSPASSAISTLAPSMVPMVRAPFSMNFMLPVPEASVPAVEICSDRSVAGITEEAQNSI